MFPGAELNLPFWEIAVTNLHYLQLLSSRWLTYYRVTRLRAAETPGFTVSVKASRFSGLTAQNVILFSEFNRGEKMTVRLAPSHKRLQPQTSLGPALSDSNPTLPPCTTFIPLLRSPCVDINGSKGKTIQTDVNSSQN